MPVFWRYLLFQFFKVLLLCAMTFIGILLTMRLDEIAHFATLGPHFITVLTFIFYQIPYILPIALPLSGLISALLLMQRLSTHHEIIALRASGFSFYKILAPLFFAGFALTLLNLYIVSEVATASHLASSVLKSQLRTVNPLLLLNSKHLMRLQGFYFDTLGASRLGEFAKDLVLVLPDKGSQRLTILFAKEVDTEKNMFNAKNLTLVSTLSPHEKDANEEPDQLIIENIGTTEFELVHFPHLMQKTAGAIQEDHLQLALLTTRLEDLEAKRAHAKANHESLDLINELSKNIAKIQSELARRLSFGLAAFTFVFMGAVFGISLLNRATNKKGLYWVVSLTAGYIVAYFIAQAFSQRMIMASFFYLAPHILITAISIKVLNRMKQGIA